MSIFEATTIHPCCLGAECSPCILCFMVNSLSGRSSGYLQLPLFQVFNYLTLVENESFCNSRRSSTHYSILFFPFLLANSICMALVTTCKFFSVLNLFFSTEFWKWYMGFDHTHWEKWTCCGVDLCVLLKAMNSMLQFLQESLQLQAQLNKCREVLKWSVIYMWNTWGQVHVSAAEAVKMFWIGCTNKYYND